MLFGRGVFEGIFAGRDGNGVGEGAMYVRQHDLSMMTLPPPSTTSATNILRASDRIFYSLWFRGSVYVYIYMKP